MCNTCRRTPCDPRCPNAEPEKPIYVCNHCKEGIFFEDRYAEIGNDKFCLDCLESMDIDELLAIFDISVQKAYKEEFHWS